MPATVGVVKGQLVVGLSAHEIESLGRNRNSSPSSGPNQIVKVSRRDLPYAMAQVSAQKLASSLVGTF